MDILPLLQGVPLSVAIVFATIVLGRAVLQIIKIRTEATIEVVRLEAEAKVKAAENVASAEKYRSEAAAVTAEALAVELARRARTDEQNALLLHNSMTLQAATAEALAGVVIVQKATSAAVVKSGKQASVQLESAREDIVSAVIKAQEHLMAALDILRDAQVDQSAAIGRIERRQTQGEVKGETAA